MLKYDQNYIHFVFWIFLVLFELNDPFIMGPRSLFSKKLPSDHRKSRFSQSGYPACSLNTLLVI